MHSIADVNAASVNMPHAVVCNTLSVVRRMLLWCASRSPCHIPIQTIIFFSLHNHLPIVLIADVEAERLLGALYRLVRRKRVNGGRGAAVGGTVGIPSGATARVHRLRTRRCNVCARSTAAPVLTAPHSAARRHPAHRPTGKKSKQNQDLATEGLGLIYACPRDTKIHALLHAATSIETGRRNLSCAQLGSDGNFREAWHPGMRPRLSGVVTDLLANGLPVQHSDVHSYSYIRSPGVV